MTGVSETSPVQLIFLGWDGPALPRAAKVIAQEYARPDGLDLREVVVVTPAARAGRRLAELLLEEAEARGLALTPPRTVTIGRFPELLYEKTGPHADSTISRHAFARALRTLDPAQLEEVFPHPPTNSSGWMALAGMVESLHRELGAAGYDFRGVAGEFRKGFPYDDSARWEALAKVQDAYLEVLRESGVQGRLTAPGEVWLVGVVELPQMVREMVAALPGPIRALVHAPEEIQDRFDALGCVLPGEWQRAPVPVADEQIRVVQHPRDQAAATAAALAGFRGRFAAEEVVVGVPDADLVPFVERCLSGVGVPHRFAGGRLLQDTGPVRLLKALGEYLDGRPYPAFAALIRHPDLHEVVEGAGGGEGDPSSSGAAEEGNDREVTGALTDVDRFQSEHLQDTMRGPLPGEDKYARRTRRLAAHLDRAMGLVSLGGVRPLSEWMPDVLEVLVRVYGGQPLDRSNPRIRDMVDAVTRIKGAATRLATLPRSLNAEVEAPEALAMLLAEVTGPDMTIPPDPEEHAVELLGWLEIPLDDAPAVIVTAVNERILPEAVGADPFLPGALRTRLAIPDDEARYARDAYLLSALLESREEVHLVAGRLTAQGDPLRPSRLLFAAEPEEVAKRIRRYLGDEEKGDGGPGSEREGPESGVPDTDGFSQSRFRSPPQDPLPALASLTRIRVTDFATYLSDPYRYAMERVLNLEPLDDGAREMDGGGFGSLAHTVLEQFGRSEEASSDDADGIRKRLSLLLDRAVRDGFGPRPVPAVRVQVEQLRTRLRRFARWQAGWAAEGWRVMSVEGQPEPGVSFDVDGKPVLLRGKIDRIDHNPRTGEWAIFDYKTGDTGKTPEEVHRKGRKNQREWIDLQLPLYRVLLPDILKEDGTPLVPESAWKDVCLGYILLPRELDKVGAAVARWTEEELAEAEETARRVIRELRTNEFHYDPGTQSFRGDPLDALRGRLELPRADDGEEGGDG
jgi:ATP-dependent helicase/nuclease subunit B